MNRDMYVLQQISILDLLVLARPDLIFNNRLELELELSGNLHLHPTFKFNPDADP
jgi:hypothetical protein